MTRRDREVAAALHRAALAALVKRAGGEVTIKGGELRLLDRVTGYSTTEGDIYLRVSE